VKNVMVGFVVMVVVAEADVVCDVIVGVGV